MKNLAAIAGLAALVATSNAVAQQSAATDSANSGDQGNRDSERVICRRIQEVGSRLASRRVCMTAAQWSEQRRLERMDLERSQAQQSVPRGS
jgi:hypothetical protein